MNWLHSRIFKVISFVVLFFFTWTSGGLFQAAYAIKDGGKGQEVSGQQKQKEEKAEEKLQKALDEIEGVIEEVQKSKSAEEHKSKKEKLKTKKSEIGDIDVEIKKQFKETEDKITDLPDEILQRHKDFVKHYDDNLKELNTNLDAIDKAKNKEETDAAIDKTKAFLEKVKPPKKHTPLDPDNLPHRTAEPEWIEPRTQPEQFQQEEGQVARVKGQGEFSAEAQKSGSATAFPTLAKGGKGGFDKPVLVASNGSLNGILSDAVIPVETGIQGSGYPIETFGYDKLNKVSEPSNVLLAAATPPTEADLSQTIEVQFTPEITAKAEELQHNPVKIYNWVRNNIEFVPTHGSIQGANMCLQTKQCNAFDTASLLIALLRVSGIHAKYVQGTVEIPVEKIKNWVGGFTDTMSALNLLASAGIPTAGQVVGGEIKYVRIEHIWVEAYVDYLPSRGAKHKVGDTWIPLDASFKQYNYTQGIDIQSAVPFDAEAFVNQIQSTATINEPEGYVTGVDSLFISQTMTDYQTQVQNYITQTYPNATVGDVLGKKEIIKQEFPHFLGTLPYMRIVTGTKYASIPDNLRHRITFNVTKDIYDIELGTPINITKSLPELAGKKITLSYSPATPADEAVINKYLPRPHTDGTPIDPSELPTSLPAYLINVKPEIRVDGQVIATGSTIGLGVNETFTMSFSGPGANARDVIINEVKSGNYYGIAFDLGRISQEQMQALKTKLESTKAKLEAQNLTGLTKDDVLGDLLYTTALSYHAELGVMNQVTAKTMGLVAITYPSETMFSFELKSNYYFGIPVSVSPSGLAMDADRLIALVKSLDGDIEKPKQFMRSAGSTGSALEHAVPEQLWSTPENPAYGISAVKALQIANDQGIPIYTINKTNINIVLPQLQIDYDDKTDIKNAVNAGKEVTVSKTNITYNGWTGIGYIVIDPKTGAGGYMISGGMSGAWLMIVSGLLLIFAGLSMCFPVTPACIAGLGLIGEGVYFVSFGLCLLLNDHDFLSGGIGSLLTGLLAAYVPLSVFGLLIVEQKIGFVGFVTYIVFQDWIEKKLKEVCGET